MASSVYQDGGFGLTEDKKGFYVYQDKILQAGPFISWEHAYLWFFNKELYDYLSSHPRHQRSFKYRSKQEILDSKGYWITKLGS